MNITTNIRNYFDNEKLEINISENKLYIINYSNIDNFSREMITIKHKNGTIKISGQKLVINKLLKDEVLISGEIKNIEFR